MPAFFLGLPFAGAAQAQSVTWTATSGTNASWFTTSDWTTNTSTNALPVASDNPTLIQTPGVVSISGAAATAGRLQVLGGGEVDVLAGGTLSTAYLSTIGLAPSLVTNLTSTATSGTGTMIVSGAGSAWNAGSTGVRVGNAATGTLTIASGGALNMTGGLLSVGINTGGNGTLNINDGTVTNSAAAIRLGYDGAVGTLNITNGGTLTTTNLNSVGLSDGASGYGTGGSGNVTISGANSAWTITAGVAGSNGNLNIGNGTGTTGTIMIAAGGTLSDAGNAYVGYLGGTGSVTVTGAGSSWTEGTGNTGALVVGAESGSTGTVLISAGGVVNTSTLSAFIGFNDTASTTGGTGTVTVTGAGSTLNAAGDLYLGNGAGSTGTLNIGSGGKVSVAGETLVGVNGNGATGTVNVTAGGTFAGNNMVVGFNSATTTTTPTGTFNVSGGGQATFTGAVDIALNGGTGTALITGAGSSLTSASYVAVGYDAGAGLASNGTLTVANGATLTATTLQIGLGAQGTGILNIGNGGAAGIINAPITMGGKSSTINFNQNGNYTFSGTISNIVNGPPTTGSVNFIGSGDTTLTGVNTYTSPTNVTAGTLTIAAGGSIANSSLTTIGSGATLAGAGSLGAVTVANGATVAPTGTGTLTTGAITFANGSAYQVNITPAGQSGKIAATTATLQGGTVQVLPSSGTYLPGLNYVILSASGGVTGQFANLSGPSFAFLNTSLTYSQNAVDFAVTRNNTSFASVAATPNQMATAGAVSQLSSSNAVYQAVLQQSAAGAQAAFNALSGEVYASSQAALINDATLVADLIGRRLSQPFEGSNSGFGSMAVANFNADNGMPSSVLNYASQTKSKPSGPFGLIEKPAPVAPPLFYSSWVQGFGDWMNHSGNGNAAALTSSTGGLLAGVDATYLGIWRVGVAGGYSGTNIQVADRASSASTNNYHLSVYGGTQQGAYGLQLGGTYNWHDINSTRLISFPGYSDMARANYNANSAQVFGEANYRWKFANSVIEPFAGIDYVNLQTDGFGEQGGASALIVSSADRGVAFSTIGVRASQVLIHDDAGVDFVGRGTLGWRHAMGDTDTNVLAAFPGVTPFSVSGTPIARDALLAEAGLDANIRPNMSIGVLWTGQFASNANSNALRGQFVYRW